MEIKPVFVCVLRVVLLGCCVAIDLNQDLRRLAEMLPGIYTNTQRNFRNYRNGFKDFPWQPHSPAEALTTMPINAIYQPVEVSFLPDCFNLYVEQTLYGSKKPRIWIYSFSAEHSTRSIRLKIYDILHASVIEKISKNPHSVKYLSESDVTTSSECDMYWRRLKEMFVGTTSRQCLAMVGDSQVRISVSTTLTSTSLQIDEGWYNTHDGSKLIELEGPIFLTKMEKIADNPFLDPLSAEPVGHRHVQKGDGKTISLQKDGRIRRHRGGHVEQNALPQGHSRDMAERPIYRHPPKNQGYASNNVPDDNLVRHKHNEVEKLSSQEVKLLKNVIRKSGFKATKKEIPRQIPDSKYNHVETVPSQSAVQKPKYTMKSTWNIQTYSGIIDALVSGHKVYFSAKTKKCHHTNTQVKDRSTFGDYVEVFEIRKDFSEKQPNVYISFSFKRLEQTKKGFQEVVKDILVHRNGSVHITTVYMTDSGDIDRHAFAECALYNQDNGKGDVRFYLDPYRDVHPIAKYNKLRSALQKGKMVRLTTEFDKCNGGKSDHVILGGEIRGFDLGRNGKSVHASLKRYRVTNTPANQLSVEEQFTIFKFSKRGETTVVKHPKDVTRVSRNYSIVTGFLRYKCETDPNSSTKAISLYNS